MFVVQQTLPSISYLTLLDYFVYAMLMLVGFQLILLNIFSINGIDIKESTMLYVSLGAWLALHIGFGILAFVQRKVEMKKLSMDREEMKKYYAGKIGSTYHVEHPVEDFDMDFTGTIWGPTHR